MSPIVQLLVAALVLATLAAWTSSLLVNLLFRGLKEFRFRLSTDFWFAAATFPVVAGTMVALYAVGSGWLSRWNWIPDHCLEDGGQPHLCLAHIGNLPPGPLSWLIAALAAVSIGYAGASISRSLRASFLQPGDGAVDETRFCLYPSRLPAAFTAGLLFPRAYITTEAARRLSVEEKALILAHEREHIRRRDPLRLLILQFLERGFPGLDAVRSHWQASAEMDCDRAAVRQGFAPEIVAATILKMTRATNKYLRPVAILNYTGDGNDELLRRRVEVLFSDQEKGFLGMMPIAVLLVSVILLGPLFFMEIHHALETVLGWLT